MVCLSEPLERTVNVLYVGVRLTVELWVAFPVMVRVSPLAAPPAFCTVATSVPETVPLALVRNTVFCALAVSEKLIDRGGALRPGDAALRREAALILYRMYRKVYGYND